MIHVKGLNFLYDLKGKQRASHKNLEQKMFCSGIKTLKQCLGTNKKFFLGLIFTDFFLYFPNFFSFLAQNIEKADFNLCL